MVVQGYHTILLVQRDRPESRTYYDLPSTSQAMERESGVGRGWRYDLVSADAGQEPTVETRLRFCDGLPLARAWGHLQRASMCFWHVFILALSSFHPNPRTISPSIYGTFNRNIMALKSCDLSSILETPGLD